MNISTFADASDLALWRHLAITIKLVASPSLHAPF